MLTRFRLLFKQAELCCKFLFESSENRCRNITLLFNQLPDLHRHVLLYPDTFLIPIRWIAHEPTEEVAGENVTHDRASLVPTQLLTIVSINVQFLSGRPSQVHLHMTIHDC